MRFFAYFTRQRLRDRHYRMAMLSGQAIGVPLFATYPAGDEYLATCNHAFDIGAINPEMEDHLLDFTTEGRWLCQMNFRPTPTGGIIRSIIQFELQSDYAMFRMFGFAE